VKTRLLVPIVLSLSILSACKPPPPKDVLPDYVAAPVALAFEACPVKDETGKAVVDVFPDEKKVTITNQSKGVGGLKMTFEGDGAAAFATDLKRADPMNPEGLGSLSEVIVPVMFTPVKKGVVKAQLVISDDIEGTEDQKVDLVGTGSDLAAQPTIKVSVLNVADAYDDCLEGVVCTQNFADTLYKESATVEVKVTNTGCPSLKITGIEITPQGGAGNLAYFIDAPSVLPTTDTPLVLTQAGGLQTTKFKIRFAPEDDGSGNLTRFATLRIKTNDPNAKDGDNNTGGFDILLAGSALEPSIYTTPTRCDFSDPADLCGNATKIAGKANFLVKNGGNVAIKIDSTTFKSNSSETAGQDNRLTVTGTPIKGVTILPGASAPIEISHTEMPLYIQDLVTISASVPAGAPGSAGRAILSLSGGKKPCLSTDPAIDMLTGQARLDFAAPMTELSAKEVTIKNGPAATCGDLIIKAVEVLDSNPFFSLLDPMITAGTKIAPGGELKVTVQYKKPVSGGTQVGSLRINTNDGDFATPPGYIIQLYSQSPLDQLPVAIAKGCVPTDLTCAMGKVNAMSVNLSMLPAGPNGTRLFTVWGKESFDPPSNTMALPFYLFRLVSKPSNATEASLENDGLKNAKSAVELKLDGAAVGLYRVTLDVWDDKNQKSGTSSELKINVFQ
jgi:hypothetical protein